ncbi:MAG: hypothetical protein IH956_00930 [Chloroflexi bacterium]|nr:hypothetical protein [Chloroflexota bacterium]
MRHLWVGSLLLAAAALLPMQACGGSDEPAVASEKFGLLTTEELAPEPIQSENLASNYMRQTEAADARYKGKVVEIEGLITEVGRTADDVPYIGMTGMAWLLVQCIFPESWTGDLPQLTIAQPAVLRGRVEGLLDNVRVGERQFFESSGVRLTLSDCAVVE